MATITTRAGKGSPLTNTEVDDNFSNLNSAKYESGATPTFGNVTASGYLALGQTTSFPTTGFISHTNGYLYGEGGSNGIILRSASGTSQLMFLTASEVVVNNDSLNMDFRVESNSNSHMFFVDASGDHISIGTSADLSATLNINGNVRRGGYTTLSNFNSNNDVLAFNYNIPPSSTNVTPIYYGVAAAGGAFIHMESGGGGTLDFRAAMHGTDSAGFAYQDAGKYLTMRPTAKSAGELIVNQDSDDIDFRVESDGNANALFVDAGQDLVKFGFSSGLNLPSTRTFEAIAKTGLGVGDSPYTFALMTNEGTAGNLSIIANAYPANIGSDRYVWIKGGSAGGGGPTEIAQFSTGTGTVLNEAGAAAQDFRVESDGNANMLAVDAGGNQLGIGTSPSFFFHVDSGGSTDVGVFESDHATTTNLYIRNTNATTDNTANLYMAPANSVASTLIRSTALEDHSSSANRSAMLSFQTRSDGAWYERLRLNKTEAVFNEVSQNYDFRVESDGNANMLFVDGGNNRVGIGNNAPGSQLDVGDTTYHDGTLSVNGSIGLNTSSNLNPSLNRWAMRVRADGNEGHLDFYDARHDAARVTFDDGGKVGIGKSPASYDGMLTVENANATRSYVDRVRTEWNSIFNVTENTHHQRFKLTVDTSRRSSLVKVTCQPRSSGGISNMNGCEMVLSVYRADGNAAFALMSITNGGHGSGSIRFAQPTTSGNSVIFSLIVGNNGTGSTYQVATKVEVLGNTDNNLVYEEIAGSTAGTGADPGIGHFFYANSVPLAGFGTSGTTFNESGDSRDFRVESSAHTHALAVDASENAIYFGKNTNSDFNQAGMIIRASGEFIVTRASDVATFNRITSDGTLVRWRRQNVTVGQVSVNATSATYHTTSDRRLKKDIKTITDGTDKLMAMNPVTHGWKAHPEADTVHGFVAQEMLGIVPEAVAGDPEGDAMMSIDYGRITPVLVAALQDAHKKIAELETRLNELEGK